MKTIKLNNVFFGIKFVDYVIKFVLIALIILSLLGEPTGYNSIWSMAILLIISANITVIWCGPFVVINLLGFILGMKGIKDNGFKGKKKLKAGSILGIISSAVDIVTNIPYFGTIVYRILVMGITAESFTDAGGVLSVCMFLYSFILLALNIVMLIISIMNVSKLSRV